MSDDLDLSSISDDEKRAVRRRRWWVGIFGHAGTVSLSVGAILLAFGVASSWLFWSGVVLSVLGITHVVVAGPRYVRIIKEHREAQVRARERAASLATILDSALEALMSDLSVDFQRARVSVYQHKDDSFILLARVSEKLQLRQRGRTAYPDNEGVIGQAWDEGLKVVVDLPADRSEWNQRCVERYGMGRQAVERLSMQSRSLVGSRITTNGTTSHPVGLLLLESLDARGVNGGTVDKMRQSPNFGLLSLILEVVVQSLDEEDVAQFVEATRAAPAKHAQPRRAITD